MAPRSTSNPRSRAFIEVQIPGLALKRVTFELNHSLATVMATKFLEYCVGAYHPGYLGSSLFQVNFDRWIHLDRVRSPIICYEIEPTSAG